MVSAFGIPINLIIPFQEINLGYDLTLPENVESCFHAQALDEYRQAFRVTRLDSGHTNPKIEEIWFRAVHTDVGGGTGNYKLSNTWLV